MKRRLTEIFITAFILFSSANAAASQHIEAMDDDNQNAICAGINNYRFQHGLIPLKMNQFISEVAKNHSREMAENIVAFGHIGFSQRVSKVFAQFKQPRAIAENVALTTADAKTAVQMWIDSRGHRQNIEGHYNLTGIGIAHDKFGRAYITQIFLYDGSR